MAIATFPKAMPHILAYEGGWSNHPRDPGGVTLEGIIQKVYDGYREKSGLKKRALTPSMRNTAEWKRERDHIYRRQYWDAVSADELPPGIDFVVFDGAVNSGPVQSAKWLQRALGMNNVDGQVGAATLAAVRNHPDHDALIADICGRRMAFLRQLRTWNDFGKGWSARVSNVKKTGQAWASGSVGPQPVSAWLDGGDAKAVASDIVEAPVSVGKSATTGAGAGAAVEATTQLQDVAAQIAPIAETLIVVKYVFIALTLAAAVLTFYGIFRSWKAQRARNGEDVAAVPDMA
jgi:lysozyme family protein